MFDCLLFSDFLDPLQPIPTPFRLQLLVFDELFSLVLTERTTRPTRVVLSFFRQEKVPGLRASLFQDVASSRIRRSRPCVLF